MKNNKQPETASILATSNEAGKKQNSLNVMEAAKDAGTAQPTSNAVPQNASQAPLNTDKMPDGDMLRKLFAGLNDEQKMMLHTEMASMMPAAAAVEEKATTPLSTERTPEEEAAIAKAALEAETAITEEAEKGAQQATPIEEGKPLAKPTEETAVKPDEDKYLDDSEELETMISTLKSLKTASEDSLIRIPAPKAGEQAGAYGKRALMTAFSKALTPTEMKTLDAFNERVPAVVVAQYTKRLTDRFVEASQKRLVTSQTGVAGKPQVIRTGSNSYTMVGYADAAKRTCEAARKANDERVNRMLGIKQ